ncbi:uncharacterized protein LOC110848474 isoform X2 [Folsomia candida]|uniref:uncharacterized protein LOC110848474 isoform X2 n=1 Tax=Folsomia candida TaxID=158441 RepID=UPI001604A772|nr:uncharacterized protein LOC110848474 isoform X2 [Folsomia candida]
MDTLLTQLEKIEVGDPNNIIRLKNNINNKSNANCSSSINPNLLNDLVKRAQTFFSLSLFRKCLQCSETVLDIIPSDIGVGLDLENVRLRGVDIKGKALLGLGEYEECLIFLGRESKILKNLGLKLPPPMSPVYTRHLQHWKYLMERGKVLQRQKIRGEIDMGAFIPNKKVRLEVDSVVEYESEAVEIGAVIPGRGVVARQDIAKGTIILTTRAFEIIFDTDDEDDDLENAIAQRMRLDSKLIPTVYQLHAGKEMGCLFASYITNSENHHKSKNNDNNDGTTMKIDLKRIEKICTMNSFGNSKNSSGYGHNSRGLWVRASFFNHDCIAFNAMWKVLGDFLFVRTTKDVKKGEEVLISYTDSAEPYEEREKFFQAHDFSCACRLCQYQEKEDVKMRGRRLEIVKKLVEIDEKDRKTISADDLEKDIAFGEKCLSELESMIGSRPEWNFSTHVALDLLTKLYLQKGDVAKYKETAVKYYIVVNCSGMTKAEIDKCELEDVADRGPCLEVGAAGQVCAVFMKSGDYVGAQKWIKILRQDLALMYGKGSDILKKLYPQLYAQAVKNGLSLD